MANKDGFQFFYAGRPIGRFQFEKNVPNNWMDLVDNGQFNHGLFMAIKTK